ncbi:MAG: hypothetical protein MZV70_09280 [Desulfobacterales bacterium]|nr:hypothetical protein [Desulfobacterales bacterium]
MTSYDVIRRLKKLHPFNKIGYIGTLDRNATGILPVALNDGVKLIPFLENGEKAYKARFLLGITTDTLDIEGKVLSQVETKEFDQAFLEEKLSRVQGERSPSRYRRTHQRRSTENHLYKLDEERDRR